MLLDLENKQCATKSDCDGLTKPGETYLCKSGICQRETCEKVNDDQSCQALADKNGDSFRTSICDEDVVTGTLSCLPAECKESDDCGDGDAAQVCDIVAHRCKRDTQATCETDKDCKRYEGQPICVDKLCRDKECSKNEECVDLLSAAATCQAGKCVDPAWGCLGSEPEPMGTDLNVTYEIGVLDPISQELPADLEFKACGAVNDPGCANGPPGVTYEYSKEEKLVRVRGLPANFPVHFYITAPGDSNFPIDFYSQQPLNKRVVKAAAPMYVIPRFLADQVRMYTNTSVDMVYRGTLVGRVLDCNNELAEGVAMSSSFEASDPEYPTAYFFLQRGNIADADLVATTDYGTTGATNLTPGKPITLTFTLGSKEVATSDVTPKAGWLTYTHVFPIRKAK